MNQLNRVWRRLVSLVENRKVPPTKISPRLYTPRIERLEDRRLLAGDGTEYVPPTNATPPPPYDSSPSAQVGSMNPSVATSAATSTDGESTNNVTSPTNNSAANTQAPAPVASTTPTAESPIVTLASHSDESNSNSEGDSESPTANDAAVSAERPAADDTLPDATTTAVEKLTTELTEAEIAACTGLWESLTIRVFVTDYFNADFNGMLNEVAEFYQGYCIHITWDVVQIDSPPDVEYIGPTIAWEGLGSHDYSVHANSNEPYLGSLDIYTPEGQPTLLTNEPDLEWYWDNFDHVPSVFLIGDIDLPGVTIPGPDAFGLNYGPFIFLPDTWALWAPDYELSLAQEIGHLLGLPEGTSTTSVMGEGASTFDGLENSGFTAAELITVHQSEQLTAIPDPEPISPQSNP